MAPPQRKLPWPLCLEHSLLHGACPSVVPRTGHARCVPQFIIEIISEAQEESDRLSIPMIFYSYFHNLFILYMFYNAFGQWHMHIIYKQYTCLARMRVWQVFKIF